MFISIMITNLLLTLLVAAFVGAAAGYIGSFMVLKRMALVGDALSHVALPGMALALLFHVSPIVGAFVALFCAVVGVWHLQRYSSMYPEALVGLFFTASLAVGMLLTPELELLEVLFGDIGELGLIEGISAIVLSLVLIVAMAFLSKRLLLGIISEDIVQSLHISISKVNFIYLLLVGAVVALGVQFVGTLLMGALVVIPAIAAKNISKNMRQYSLYSAMIGLFSAITGLAVSYLFNIPSGPAVVLSGIAIFLITYIIRRPV